MSDRGLIALGMAADITVFDPNTIIDHATYENPALPSEGVKHVFVNGVLALKDGAPTGAGAAARCCASANMPSRPTERRLAHRFRSRARRRPRACDRPDARRGRSRSEGCAEHRWRRCIDLASCKRPADGRRSAARGERAISVTVDQAILEPRDHSDRQIDGQEAWRRAVRSVSADSRQMMAFVTGTDTLTSRNAAVLAIAILAPRIVESFPHRQCSAPRRRSIRLRPPISMRSSRARRRSARDRRHRWRDARRQGHFQQGLWPRQHQPQHAGHAEHAFRHRIGHQAVHLRGGAAARTGRQTVVRRSGVAISRRRSDTRTKSRCAISAITSPGIVITIRWTSSIGRWPKTSPKTSC